MDPLKILGVVLIITGLLMLHRSFTMSAKRTTRRSAAIPTTHARARSSDTSPFRGKTGPRPLRGAWHTPCSLRPTAGTLGPVQRRRVPARDPVIVELKEVER